MALNRTKLAVTAIGFLRPGTNSTMCFPSLSRPIHLFSEPGLDEGLVRHIAIVRLALDSFGQRKRALGRTPP